MGQTGRFRWALCIVSICFLGGCYQPPMDPLDDVSSVAQADRPELQKCLATPDLPGNHWPEHAGKARCWLSLPQDPSLREIAGMLKEPDGALKLDARYAAILAAHYKDPAHRDALFRAYRDFGSPEGRRVASDWMARSPGSSFARTAEGAAALGAAWEARGSGYAADTTDTQFQGMTEQLKTAVPMLQSALHYEPRLSPACVDLMEIGGMVDDTNLQQAAMRHCAKVDPLSWEFNEEWLRSADPRWGGSFLALDLAVGQIRLRERDNPVLASLLAKAIGRRAYMQVKDDSDMLPIGAEMDRAALTAPDPFYIDKAAVAAGQMGDGQKALLYFSQALRFAPDNADFLIDRAQLLTKTHDPAALVDARRAAAQPDPCGCKDDASLALVFYAFNKVDDERTELLKIVPKKDQHQWALTTLCKTYISPEFDSGHALPCTQQLVAEFPEDREALYLRALALYAVHDLGASDVDARFRQRANAADPSEQAEMVQLDEVSKVKPQPQPQPVKH